MGLKASTCIIIFSLITFFTTTVSAFNITRLLNNHPEFNTFNNLLTQTGLATDVNARQTITVLVVADSDMGSVSGKDEKMIKKIIATHVLLTYMDSNNIAELSKNNSVVTNLFQTTGLAYKQQGETKVATSGGVVVFGSAMEGAQMNSKMVKSVEAQPWNISVIQINQPIVTPGLDQATANGPSGSPKAVPPTPMAAPPSKKANQTETEAPSSEEDESVSSPESSEGEGPVLGPSPSPSEDDKENPAKLSPVKGNGARVAASGLVLGFMGLLALCL